jgi:hypothetical protein
MRATTKAGPRGVQAPRKWIRSNRLALGVKKVADPDGGERAVITLNGKYLPVKPF